MTRLDKDLMPHDRMAALTVLASNLAESLKKTTTFLSGNVLMLADFWKTLEPLAKKEAGQSPSEGDEMAFTISEFSKTLKNINHSIKELNGLAKGLKPYTRLDVQGFTLVEAATPLKAALDLTDHLFGPHVSRDIQIEPVLPSFFGNAHQVTLAMVNVLINAADAMENMKKTETGAEAPHKKERLTVRAYRDHHTLRYEFQDTGPGVPPEFTQNMDMTDKIWQPLFSTKPPTQGAGMGLPIARVLLQSHQGTIVLGPPQPGHGACFRITLPAT
ncbi:MAG: HAMP domain-containing histidine kinase [Deltaproteobacteria bacterium]|nr:HAMP domain-containing histidine kinase [Deltaproteobacteria bacterium]